MNSSPKHKVGMRCLVLMIDLLFIAYLMKSLESSIKDGQDKLLKLRRCTMS